MKTKHWMLFLLASVFLAVITPARAARLEPVYTPLPIELDNGFTRSEVGEIISDSLINSGWHQQPQDGGGIRAFHARGRSVGRMEIVYSARLIEFRYTGSERMNAQVIDGIEHIQRLYNVWVHDFENALKFRKNQVALQHEQDTGKAPVREVKLPPVPRKRAVIKTIHGDTAAQENKKSTVEVTTIRTPGLNRETEESPAVHDVIIQPEPNTSELKTQHGGRETPAETTSTSPPTIERLPSESESSSDPSGQSPDLGELKW